MKLGRVVSDLTLLGARMCIFHLRWLGNHVCRWWGFKAADFLNCDLAHHTTRHFLVALPLRPSSYLTSATNESSQPSVYILE